MNTIIWVLILFAHVGPAGDGNSNALATVDFSSKAKCETAGIAATKLASGTTKEIRYVCVEK